jgi:hypothetical protein
MQAILDGKVLDIDRSKATPDEVRILKEIRWLAALVLMHCLMIIPVYLAAQIVGTLRRLHVLKLALLTMSLTGAAYAMNALWLLAFAAGVLLLMLSPIIVIRVRRALGWLPPRPVRTTVPVGR